MAATASASKTRRAILVLFVMLFFMGALHHNHYQKTEYLSLRGEIEPTMQGRYIIITLGVVSNL